MTAANGPFKLTHILTDAQVERPAKAVNEGSDPARLGSAANFDSACGRSIGQGT